MRWKNAHHDAPPDKGQFVVISVKGVYYVASYDSDSNIFRLKDRPETFFNPADHYIYWIEYSEN